MGGEQQGKKEDMGVTATGERKVFRPHCRPYVGEQKSNFGLQGGGTQYIREFWNSYFTT